MSLHEEFQNLIRAFDESGIDYALCGGLAMAVYNSPRATMDVDLMIPVDILEQAKVCAQELGYSIDTGLVKTRNDRVQIYRMVKPDYDSEPIVLDLLLVNDALQDIWDGRQRKQWLDGSLSVVSRTGLIQMKKLRGNGRDMDDIRFLEDVNES